MGSLGTVKESLTSSGHIRWSLIGKALAYTIRDIGYGPISAINMHLPMESLPRPRLVKWWSDMKMNFETRSDSAVAFEKRRRF